MILLLRTYKSSPYLSPYLSVYIFAIFPSLLLSPDLFIRQSRKQRKKTHTLTLWKHDPIPLRVCHFNHLLISFPSITPSSILLSCANTGIKTIHSPTRNNIPLMNIFHVHTLTLLLFSFFRLHLYLFFLHMFYLSPLILLSFFPFYLSFFLYISICENPRWKTMQNLLSRQSSSYEYLPIHSTFYRPFHQQFLHLSIRLKTNLHLWIPFVFLLDFFNTLFYSFNTLLPHLFDFLLSIIIFPLSYYLYLRHYLLRILLLITFPPSLHLPTQTRQKKPRH